MPFHNIDIEGIMPPSVSFDILAIAAADSAVLQLARTLPMPAGVTSMPVQTARPQAAWVSGPGGRKPVGDFALRMVEMTAEEIAVTIPIPEVYLDDAQVNLWNFVRPQLGDAIRERLDAAVLFGDGAPPSFPQGGIADHATTVAAGSDALDTVNLAMSTVEAQGLPVTGASADLGVRGALRGIRDSSGALLFGPSQGTSGGDVTPFGTRIVFGQYPIGADANFITGDWQALQIGVRQDIRYRLSDSGVLADDAGVVQISAFQDNVVLMKAWARYGCLIVDPPTMRRPQGATPFAMANLPAPVEATSAGNGGGAGGQSAQQAQSGEGAQRGRPRKETPQAPHYGV